MCLFVFYVLLIILIVIYLNKKLDDIIEGEIAGGYGLSLSIYRDINI